MEPAPAATAAPWQVSPLVIDLSSGSGSSSSASPGKINSPRGVTPINPRKPASAITEESGSSQERSVSPVNEAAAARAEELNFPSTHPTTCHPEKQGLIAPVPFPSTDVVITAAVRQRSVKHK